MRERCPLELTFASLRADGVDARHNFGECGSAGHWALTRDVQSDCTGYAFYHKTAAESATNDGELYVHYASYSPRLDDNVAIARKILKHAEEAGVKHAWRGRVSAAVLLDLCDADVEFVRGLRDDDFEAAHGGAADRHRAGRLFHCWRVQAFAQRVAKRKVRAALMEWGARPGGPMYAVAARRFRCA
jgi:hypothetical protein